MQHVRNLTKGEIYFFPEACIKRIIKFSILMITAIFINMKKGMKNIPIISPVKS